MIAPAKWREILDVNERYRRCRERGFHVRSGEKAVRLLGGESVEMERCAECGVLCDAAASTSRTPVPWGEQENP
jgi:hypothetical protein